MSRIEIYVIDPDGVVQSWGEERNASACLPHIWGVLAAKYSVPDPLRRFGKAKPEREPLWDLYGSGKLSAVDNAVLGFTFDASWCPFSKVPQLADALADFWEHYPVQYVVDRKAGFGVIAERVDDTIARVAAALRKLAGDPSHAQARGVCFNQTSVNSNPWEFYNEEADEMRPFVFGKDARDANGAEPVELFAEAPGGPDHAR